MERVEREQKRLRKNSKKNKKKSKKTLDKFRKIVYNKGTKSERDRNSLKGKKSRSQLYSEKEVSHDKERSI